MIATKKTPGVYIEEITFFPPAIAAVDTAVPAFIGYTEKEDHVKEAIKIRSLLEFEELFTIEKWELTFIVNEKKIEEEFSRNQLYYHMQLYFGNGGGKCYVISLGRKPDDPRKEDFLEALDVLAKEDEPTLIVMPEATELGFQNCMDVYQSALAQAANLMDRFVILDVPDSKNPIEDFRNGIGMNNLRYGAAYYPHLNTTISKYALVNDADIKFKNSTDNTPPAAGAAPAPRSLKNSNLSTGHLERQNMIKFIKEQTLVLPPSAAIAGVYCSVDSTRGVWKAPANISLNFVSSCIDKITNEEQAELNVHTEGGKSINAIRAFTGQGIMVWGARTLAGNDNEWRYVNVRRFYNFVEESVKKAAQQFVFEPNDANTWTRVSSMIENFLTNLWRQGALAGATAQDAFFVKVGLDVTITRDDLLNGIMNIEIGLAVVRPAEFIVLRFSQKMQES
ncbi:MAG TPA: phage tail sheath C-terminal domain-containing protein [Chryseolinea sp.]|nr:phage tail sheath C-terminal domain-containing protein [Chryseolinea sp.]